MLSTVTINNARYAREIIRSKTNHVTLNVIVGDLKKKCFTMTRSGWTLLHEAVRFNNEEAIRILHNHGHPILVYNEMGFNALHCAAVWNYTGCIKILIALGHPIDAFDHYYKTPLHLAVSCLNVESVSYLLDNFADKHRKDTFQQTPEDVLSEMIANGNRSLKVKEIQKLLS
jgi:ankyrin repeat protein